MNKLTLLFLVLICFFYFGNLKAQNEIYTTSFTMYASPKSLPHAFYYDLDHKEQSLSSYQGKVLVVNFWKPNCRLCLIELPTLDNLQTFYKNADVQIIAIAEDTNIKAIQEALHTRRLKNITVFYDKDEKLLKAFGGQKVPRTLLINKEGKEVGYIQGLAKFDSPKIQNQISKLLK